MMTVQLQYMNHLLQFFNNISDHAGIMLNAFSNLLCSKLCLHNRLVPTQLDKIHSNICQSWTELASGMQHIICDV